MVSKSGSPLRASEWNPSVLDRVNIDIDERKRAERAALKECPGVAEERSLPGRSPQTQSHRQLRLEAWLRRACVVGRNLPHLRILAEGQGHARYDRGTRSP
jgi:hypothetical protein